uniref:Uncharacterized protein n=1 Tax=mine drainage metagenome TaxID=410659 RepID=E6PPZ1_9ZZZZ
MRKTVTFRGPVFNENNKLREHMAFRRGILAIPRCWWRVTKAGLLPRFLANGFAWVAGSKLVAGSKRNLLPV